MVLCPASPARGRRCGSLSGYSLPIEGRWVSEANPEG